MVNQLRIASYNIHGWVDADSESNLDRVAEVVNRHDPDILCLQEVYACWELPCLLEFLRKTLFIHTLRWEGCAILRNSLTSQQTHDNVWLVLCICSSI